jgi:hypothetical protein
VRLIIALATCVLAAAASSSAYAGELQASQLKYGQPPGAQILVCPGTIAPADCNARNAVHVVVGRSSSGEIGCGVQSQQLLAGTGVAARDGQYVKVVCVRETAQAN